MLIIGSQAMGSYDGIEDSDVVPLDPRNASFRKHTIYSCSLYYCCTTSSEFAPISALT